MVWRTYQVTVAQVAIVLLGYSQERTAYEIFTPATNAVWISPDPSVTSTNGHRMLLSNIHPYNSDHGNDVKMPVYAISTAGNNVVTIREDLAED